jgi:hypothetical protein
VQEEQNQINRWAREQEALIDEEERNLEEQEAILAAKARSRGARVRQELDNRRFEVGSARSESLAQVEDEIVNDMGSAHGLDADSINSWVDGTHINGGPEGDNITPLFTNPNTSQPVSGPDMTNVTETVSANVDPYTTPFGTTTLVADCDHNISRQHHQHCQSTSSIERHNQSSTTGKMFPAVSNMVTGLRRAVTAVSGRFTAPRTSGLNVRSRTATNTLLMPSSHVAHERGCTSMITPHITCHDPHATTILDIPLPLTPSQPPPPSPPPPETIIATHHTLPSSSLPLPSHTMHHQLHYIPERISADRTDAHMNDLVSGCANHASGGGGGRIGTLPCPSRAEAMEFVAKVPTHAHMRVVHNARFSSADGGVDERWNIRDIPSDMLIDLTFDNARGCMAESSFGKSCQRPSNDVASVRSILSIAAANIPTHGDIPSGCPRDSSDNVVTNLTAYCTMGVSRENAVILPSRQVNGNKIDGDGVLMDQVQVDPTTQIKVIDTYAQGLRDGLGSVVGDIIMPQVDRTSESAQVVSQQPLTVSPTQSEARTIFGKSST